MEVLRRDQLAVRSFLGGWDLQAASGGTLRPWTIGEPLGENVNSVWCRPTPEAPWALQLMLARTRGDLWLYRRHPSISRPVEEIGLESAEGLLYLAPELQLLYKSKTPRPKDTVDFEVVLPLLPSSRRRWLAAALRETDAGHPWIARL